MPTIGEIAEYLSTTCDVLVLDTGMTGAAVSRLASLADAMPGDVTFARRNRPGYEIPATHASVLIADAEIAVNETSLRETGVVLLALAANPRLEFARMAKRFFTELPPPSVHPDATVHEEARLASDCSIAAGAYVGRATIGHRTSIASGARILDDVTIGDDCVIYPNATLGGDGFGFERDEDGVPVKFPQRGRIIIGNRVEIGANACVDRGALSDTIIEDDAKIDNLVHIAHNVRIGRGTLIAAGALVAGSTVLGERVWVGPSATISNGLVVGDDAQITLGSVVTRDVPAGGRVSGNFAVEHDRFLAHMRSIR